MSAEQSPRQFYESCVDKLNSPEDSWNNLKFMVLPEIRLTIKSRIQWSLGNKEPFDQTLANRRILFSLYAVELFPDGMIPVLEVAKHEHDIHDDLRNIYLGRHPMSEPRLSGNIARLNQMYFKFFLLDEILVNRKSFRLRTRSQLPQVIDILLNRGFIPTDQEFDLAVI